MAIQPSPQTAAQAEPTAKGGAYVLEGTVMEACNCDVLCPCCAGENPDNSSCDAVLAYHIDRGQIQGTDVANLTVLAVIRSPGNMFQGNWKRSLILDKRASHEQSVALQEAFEGRLGGPLADLAGLVGERGEVTWAQVDYSGTGGQGSISSGDQVRATTTTIQGRAGQPITLSQTMFTTTGQAEPAQIGKVSELRVNLGAQGFTFTTKDTHAAQARFHFEG